MDLRKREDRALIESAVHYLGEITRPRMVEHYDEIREAAADEIVALARKIENAIANRIEAKRLNAAWEQKDRATAILAETLGTKDQD